MPGDETMSPMVSDASAVFARVETARCLLRIVDGGDNPRRLHTRDQRDGARGFAERRAGRADCGGRLAHRAGTIPRAVSGRRAGSGRTLPRLLHEIDGVAAGSVVTPPECAPPPVVASHSAAVQGIDHAGASRLVVTVTRPAPALRARVDQLAGCESFTSAQGDDVSKVTVSLPPAPPVDADDSYAVGQTVASETSESSLKRER